MRKAIFSLVLSMMAMMSLAQGEVTLKAGTFIPLKAVNYTKAADVRVGQSLPFIVSRDVVVDGVTILPYGTIANGIVTEAKKSKWWGTKGRLGIRIDNVVTPEGETIPLYNGYIYITGKNRTAISVLLFLFVTIPGCAICGSKAEMPAGYEVMANVASSVRFKNRTEPVQVVEPEKPVVESQPEEEIVQPVVESRSYPCVAVIEKIDGTRVAAVVYSVEDNLVSYKKQSNPNGPMYKVPMSSISKINY